MLTGFFSTLLLPETKGRSLEELSNEPQDGFLTGRLVIELVTDIG
jgi:PHS family inorganic phosphate transporter-like MFS transporter